MLVLSLDTTTRAGSCALMRDERVLREQASDTSREQAERLPGELAALLERESVALQEIDAFAVAAGPGSFTGLRVGIATMQGLAMAMGKPLIGVSAFDALAWSGGSQKQAPPYVRGKNKDRDPPYGNDKPDHVGRVLLSRPGDRIATWIDAWRGEVFAAVYEDGREVDAPTVARPENLLARLKGQATVFTGDGAVRYQELIRATLGDGARFSDPVSAPLAGTIARLAGDAFRAGQRPPPHAIRTIYVRRSDAELAREAAQAFTVREADTADEADPKGPPRVP
jgi:tRNA threonylcarbamoyladenosine biosynthesis protein TsaB